MLEGAESRIWCSKIDWQTVPCLWSIDGEAVLTGAVRARGTSRVPDTVERRLVAGDHARSGPAHTGQPGVGPIWCFLQNLKLCHCISSETKTCRLRPRRQYQDFVQSRHDGVDKPAAGPGRAEAAVTWHRGHYAVGQRTWTSTDVCGRRVIAAWPVVVSVAGANSPPARLEPTVTPWHEDFLSASRSAVVVSLTT